MSRAFRYYLILALVALGTSLAAVAGWRFARASAPVGGPIVLVTLEGMSAVRLPLYGGRGQPTPALDALAADGVVFDRAYAHASLTLPAHVALLSGRLPFDTGVRDNVGHRVPESVRLVSAMMTARGYATAGVVSAFALREETGLARGFTFFDDARGGDLAEGDAGDNTAMPSLARDATESETRVERWLSAAGTTRAFVFLQVSSLSDVKRARGEVAHPSELRDSDEEEVAHADHVVGRLIAYLKKQQLYDQATVIVTSGHGEDARSRGQHGADLAALDRVVRVPLIIKQAGHLAGSGSAGRRVSQLAQHADVVPTILDLAKAPTPSGLAGRSLRPLLEGQETAGQLAYSESLFPALHYGWTPVRMVTDGRYQYVSASMSALFDLNVKPQSRTDVSADHPEVVARLTRTLDAWTSGDELPTVTHAAALSLDERDAWLALGYLGPRSVAGDPKHAGNDERAATSVALSTPDPLLVDDFAAAMREVAHRRWTTAIERLQSLAGRHPNRLDVWESLGVIAQRGGRPEVASNAYRRVLASAPLSLDTRLRLSTTLVGARRLDEARRQAEVASGAEEPALQALAHELLARIAVAKHEPGAARVHAQHLLDVDPTSAVPAATEGRLLYERGRYDEALEWFDRAAAQADKSSPVLELHLWRAEALLKLERQAEAEDALLIERRSFPESTRPYAMLAMLYRAQGRDDEIAPLLSDMTRRLRTPDALDTAARLWTSFGDRARADEARAEARGLSRARPTIPAQ